MASVCPGILPWAPGKAASQRQAGLSSLTRGAATCQGNKSTWSLEPCNTAVGYGAPEWGSWAAGGRHALSCFYELALQRRAASSREVALVRP